MTINVAINGFGRIGRCFLRAALKDSSIDFKAINDITNPKTLAHLFKYDSVHGIYDGYVTHGEGWIEVSGKKILVTAIPKVEELPWKENNIDVVAECTGIFRTNEQASKHIKAGAKRVIISAPSPDPDATIVLGVNDNIFDPEKHFILSNASCTTNCLAPFVKVINDNFGIEKGIMTTIHSYTNDQKILDLPHKDLRRARAAGMSMIPTTTGAAKAVGLVLPEIKGKLDGMAIRVPTPNVSVVDLTAIVSKETSKEAINSVIKEAAEGPMKGILQYCDEPLVSWDFNGNPHSSIFDSLATMVLQDKMIKVLSWYDNEWGFSNRMLGLMKLISA